MQALASLHVSPLVEEKAALQQHSGGDRNLAGYWEGVSLGLENERSIKRYLCRLKNHNNIHSPTLPKCDLSLILSSACL